MPAVDDNELSELRDALDDLTTTYHEEVGALSARVKGLEGTLNGIGSALDHIVRELRNCHKRGAGEQPWTVSGENVYFRVIDMADDDERLPGTNLTLYQFYNLFDWCLSRLRGALASVDDESARSG